MNNNFFEEICKDYKKELYEDINKAGKRDYKLRDKKKFEEETNKKIETWFEFIKKDDEDIKIRIKTGQGTAKKDYPWIQIYLGEENASGIKGFYCGISFDSPNADMRTWIGVGVGSHQAMMSVKKRKDKTEDYINKCIGAIGNKLNRGYEYQDINSNGIIIAKSHYYNNFDQEDFKNDIEYLIHIYKKILNFSIEKNNNNLEQIQGRNIIYKGYPGTGKSHEVERKYLKKNEEEFIDKKRYERITFYPEYSNADFIGTIRPTIDQNGNPKYKVFAGPFTKILKRALEDKNKNNYYLIIEEINRGDAESIFGDIFQLLDRTNGRSTYTITNPIISLWLTNEKSEEEEIYIPENLSIIATMNISDENVKTLDTAFERRWDTVWISGKQGVFDDLFIKGLGDIKWGEFRNTINYEIVHQEGIIKNEDKQLGPYFVNKTFLSNNTSEDMDSRETFLNKVILYLYTKICKYDKTLIFNKKIDSIDTLLEKFESENFMDVFKDEIIAKLKKG